MDSLMSKSFDHASLIRSWSCLLLDIWRTWHCLQRERWTKCLRKIRQNNIVIGVTSDHQEEDELDLYAVFAKLPNNIIILRPVWFKKMLRERDGRTYLLLLQLQFFRHWIWCEEARQIHNWGKDCIGEKGWRMPMWNKKPQRQMMPWRYPQVCGGYNEKGRNVSKSYNPIYESGLTLFL